MLDIEKNISLAEFTTLKVGGVADFFVRVRSINELKEILKFAEEKKLPIFIFGRGSNLLFADSGFRGVVIKNEIKTVEFDSASLFQVEPVKSSMKVGSGALLSTIVLESAMRNLAGLESFAGIPGTVGGAVIGNSNSIGEKVLRVQILENDEVQTLEKKDLEFSYRNSNLRGKILVEVEIELEKTDEDLQTKVVETAREKAAKHLVEKTAGSWFRNPPDQKAWQLIEKAGCRNLTVGYAVIAKEHANFFQNAGKATATDFLELERLVVRKVEKEFGVRLEREVIVVENSKF